MAYLDYVTNDAHMQEYRKHQERYSSTIRESDKKLLALVQDAARYAGRPDSARVLDIGCSTGNFLLHLRNAEPGFELVGGDLERVVIAENQSNPRLEGIKFAEMNALDLDVARGAFDVVVANAATDFFTDEEFECAAKHFAVALRARGSLVAFDWFHPFQHEVTIVEHTPTFPQGSAYYLRSFEAVTEMLLAAGFATPDFIPFHIPVRLERSVDPADLSSYSVVSETGEGMSFRGPVFQPWCHVVARLAD